MQSPSLVVREQPRSLPMVPLRDTHKMLSPALINLVRDRLRWRAEMGVSHLLHWMRVFADPSSEEFIPDTAREVISLLTDARKIESRFGQAAVIVETDHGIRYLSGLVNRKLRVDSRPAHPFQELAAFAEAGLPASKPISTASRTRVLGDAVRDCLLNVQLREGRRAEPEWALCVAAHYSAVAAWTNRWGEMISLDGWASFLLDREPTRFCCGGTHLLQSLALLLRLARGNEDIALGRRMSERVRNRCSELSRSLADSQSPEGTWGAHWIKGAATADYRHRDLHITAHVIEAQLYLPEDLRIAHDSVRRALNCLERAFTLASDDDVMSDYCPYSHAGRVLLRCSATPGRNRI
ncbi:MAG TPA: hypothetical protein VNH11_12135 [Pirellulales bacterium]|nr:hypothetical protein [Pirellulales bacterium]